MRISDWSSDVCSSDLALVPRTDVNGARPRFAQPVLKGVLPRNIDPLKKLSRICCNAAHLPNIDVHEREVEADSRKSECSSGTHKFSVNPRRRYSSRRSLAWESEARGVGKGWDRPG